MNMHGKTGQGKVCGADDHAMNIILRIDHYTLSLSTFFASVMFLINVFSSLFFTIDSDRHEIHGMYMCFARSDGTW